MKVSFQSSNGIAKSYDHQDRFTGSEFTVSKRNPVDLCILDGCCIERYGLRQPDCRSCGRGGDGSGGTIGSGNTCTPAVTRRQIITAITRVELCVFSINDPLNRLIVD